MAKVLRIARWVGGGVVILILLVAGLSFALVRSQPGHDFFLRMALRQLPRVVYGEVAVAGIRSDGLLGGFTLYGVRIADPEGRPFLEADSLHLRYDFRELLARRLVLVPVQVWRPRITLETLPADSVLNVVRIFASDSIPAEAIPRPEGVGPGFSIVLRDLEIQDGHFLLRIPLEEGEEYGGIVETLPGGIGRVRVIRLEEIQARLTQANLLSPGGGGETFRFEHLSLTGHIFETPIRIEEFAGEVRREGGRLTLDADRLRLPNSDLRGEFSIDWSEPDGELVFDAALTADPIDLADFRWLEPSLPDGSGEAVVAYSGGLSEGRMRATGVDFQVGESRVRGRVGFDFGDGLRMTETEVELLPLELDLFDPWLEEPLPLAGVLRGSLRAEGPLDGVQLAGVLTLEDPERPYPPLTATIAGGIRLTGGIGFSELSLRVDSLDYASLVAFVPDLVLSGTGSVVAVVNGVLEEGLFLQAEINHTSPEAPASQIALSGTIVQGASDLQVALDAALAPLSLDGMAAALERPLPVVGEVWGSVQATGSLGDLSLAGRVTTAAGPVVATARFDLRDPMAGYEIEGSVEGFRAEALLPALPEGTTVTGDFNLAGSGGTLETLSGEVALALRDSELAGLELESIDAQLRAEDGHLRIEAMELISSLLVLRATGDLPLRDDLPDGEVLVEWEATSVSALRPLLFGGEPIAADTLTALERQILLLDGIDPDTLGMSDEIALEGEARGNAVLRGRLTDLRGEGTVEVLDLVYGANSLQGGEALLTGRWSQEGGAELSGTFALDTLVAAGFAFERTMGEVGFRDGAGTFAVDAESGEGTGYTLGGAFVLDSLRTEVTLEHFVLDLGDALWTLTEPARIRVLAAGVEVDGLRVARPAEDGEEEVRIEAAGILDLEGDSDFRVEMAGVDLRRVARMAQNDRLPSGWLGLELEVVGPAAAPLISGRFGVREFAFDGTALDLVEGDFDYRDRLLTARVAGELEGRELLLAEGTIPLDLAFEERTERLLDEPIGGTISLSELPAATALAFLVALEEVEGTLNGEIQLRGTARDFNPDGEVRLRGGAFVLSELGIRLTGIDADFRLSEDGRVAVEGTARSEGSARVSGSISLTDLTDPAFESLVVTASGFQAINRRDLSLRVGGEITLGGSYSAPLIEGRVVVEEGELFLEEFARSAQVIDLSDPTFFDVVDTSLVAVRPAVEAAQNPFLQNLRVEVDLALNRDFWLRSREMDVELAGDLIVIFDRSRREILLVGSVDPVRGTYTLYNRQFQVQGGTIDFVGIPGINPNLSIDAATRMRREGNEPLNVSVHVGGTLLSPTVSLTSNSQPPMAESDLISYLIFGRPFFTLASAERSELMGLGVGIGTSLVASRIGSVVGREIGLDYFNITRADDPDGIAAGSGFTNSFAYTQVELGQYLRPNLFLAVILRPLGGLQSGSGTQLPGARLEWRFTDFWSLEGFVEDRFAREGISGFGELGLRLSKIFGLSIFRDWGY